MLRTAQSTDEAWRPQTVIGCRVTRPAYDVLCMHAEKLLCGLEHSHDVMVMVLSATCGTHGLHQREFVPEGPNINANLQCMLTTVLYIHRSEARPALSLAACGVKASSLFM